MAVREAALLETAGNWEQDGRAARRRSAQGAGTVCHTMFFETGLDDSRQVWHSLYDVNIHYMRGDDVMSVATPPISTLQEVAATCACLQVRRAARAVTRLYDQTLRPVDLKITQFTVLIAVSLAGSLSITELAEHLGMERTTLTRNLRPLERRGVLEISPEGYRRVRTATITSAGRELVAQALPLWQKAQTALRVQLGPETWNVLERGLQQLAGKA